VAKLTKTQAKATKTNTTNSVQGHRMKPATQTNRRRQRFWFGGKLCISIRLFSWRMVRLGTMSRIDIIFQHIALNLSFYDQLNDFILFKQHFCLKCVMTKLFFGMVL